jgi:hypothetical protein
MTQQVTTEEHALQRSTQPDASLERRFFQATGVVMVLGTIVSGAIMLWLAATMQTPPTAAQFAVYGHGEFQVPEDPGLEAARYSGPAVFLEGTSPNLEAAFNVQNKL